MDTRHRDSAGHVMVRPGRRVCNETVTTPRLSPSGGYEADPQSALGARSGGSLMQEVGIMFAVIVLGSVLFALVATLLLPGDRDRDRHLIP